VCIYMFICANLVKSLKEEANTHTHIENKVKMKVFLKNIICERQLLFIYMNRINENKKYINNCVLITLFFSITP